MSIGVDQLLRVAQQVLPKMGVYDYTNLQINSAFKEFDEWKVDITFLRKGGIIRGIACFSVHAETEEITGMWLNRVWSAST